MRRIRRQVRIATAAELVDAVESSARRRLLTEQLVGRSDSYVLDGLATAVRERLRRDPRLRAEVERRGIAGALSPWLHPEAVPDDDCLDISSATC
jgi:hypothetical protein